VVDTSGSARSIPLDPATGGLTLQGKGLYPGQWKFDDVAASIEETTRGGAPVSILTIQAPKVPPDDHFKLYFKRPAGQIEPGTYSIDNPQGSPPMQLDASWEHARQVFRGLAGAKGSATINAVGNGRVRGTFDVSIVPLSGSGPPEVLTGSFDVKLGG
jgi:hypothetical protein